MGGKESLAFRGGLNEFIFLLPTFVVIFSTKSAQNFSIYQFTGFVSFEKSALGSSELFL